MDLDLDLEVSEELTVTQEANKTVPFRFRPTDAVQDGNF